MITPIYTFPPTGGVSEPSNASGSAIDFSAPKVYGSVVTPETGNLTADLSGAKPGVVQKMYHQNGTEPTYPAEWVQLGSGFYDTTDLNVIYFEYIDATRVEYWISQEY